ncbi:MAG TPA: prepilin-type N-terminal cleavage/methylation domain-containing protein [Phycisphaerales bacterium]
MRRAFTLIELLVVIAVVAVMIGLLFPALSAASEAGRLAVCASNLRQSYVAIRAYADSARGLTPALGQPYGRLPNWGVAVQQAAGMSATTTDASLTPNSVLVCPTTRARFGRDVTRTYAINVTGHAGLAGDPDNFDASIVHVNMDKVARPGDAPLVLDAAMPTSAAPGSPPPTRSTSVIDFRQTAHVRDRIGRVHGRDRRFSVTFFDGSVRTVKDVEAGWTMALP